MEIAEKIHTLIIVYGIDVEKTGEFLEICKTGNEDKINQKYNELVKQIIKRRIK